MQVIKSQYKGGSKPEAFAYAEGAWDEPAAGGVPTAPPTQAQARRPAHAATPGTKHR